MRVPDRRGVIRLFVLASVVTACSGPGSNQVELAEVEGVVRNLYASVSAHDMETLRTLTTADFEIIDAGARMDLGEFQAFLGTLRSGGIDLDFAVDEFNTVVAQDVAYTSLRSLDRVSGSAYLESQILRRVEGQWLVARFTSTPER